MPAMRSHWKKAKSPISLVFSATSTVPGARMCVAYLKSQIGFGRWRNTEFRIKEISTKVATDYYVRVRGIAGCGRKRDDAVYVLPVLES